MPTPFCGEMYSPAFNNEDFLWPQRPTDVFNAAYESPSNGKIVVDWLTTYTASHNAKTHWLFGAEFKGVKGVLVAPSKNNIIHDKIPYNKVLEIISSCKLNATVNLPSCFIDCIVAGVPSLVWEYSPWGASLNEIAAKHGLLIPKEPMKEQILEVINRLIQDEQLYYSYVRDYQYLFRHHTETEALAAFNKFVERL